MEGRRYPNEIKVRASVDKETLLDWITEHCDIGSIESKRHWGQAKTGHSLVLEIPSTALGTEFGNMIADEEDFAWTVGYRYYSEYDYEEDKGRFHEDGDQFVLEFLAEKDFDAEDEWDDALLFDRGKVHSVETGITYELLKGHTLS